ncbi:SRPBCC family protein [Actinomadura fulvescens]|uniref:SRPBCC family protein n=1 Tax=Actinomadura fulvescens TaxID=46160 RepID=A0ABP6CSV1_9ACTN
MAVLNIHERLLRAEPSDLAPILDSLAGPDDRLWPAERGQWPSMRFDRPLGVGARGGHGPVRYTVEGYAPGQWVRFSFCGPAGVHGFHEFTVHPAPDSGSLLRHTMAVRLRGRARLTWPLFFRRMHDALLEDCLDRAELAVHGSVEHPNQWSGYVRTLRRLARLAARLVSRPT